MNGKITFNAWKKGTRKKDYFEDLEIFFCSGCHFIKVFYNCVQITILMDFTCNFCSLLHFKYF